MRKEARHHQTVWNSQGQVIFFHLLISPHNGVWKCQPPSQWYHDWLKGGWSGESLRLPCLWTCLSPPLVVPLLNICRIQGKVSTNWKGILQGLLLWYAPSSWCNRVPCLVNLHDAWWMCRSLDFPYSPPKNISLQAPYHPPSPSSIRPSNFPWWGRRGASYRRLFRIWPHVRVGGEWFVEFCFINFCHFRDSTEYGVARAGLSELSCFYEWNWKKIPRCLSSRRTLCENGSVWRTCST